MLYLAQYIRFFTLPVQCPCWYWPWPRGCHYPGAGAPDGRHSQTANLVRQSSSWSVSLRSMRDTVTSVSHGALSTRRPRANLPPLLVIVSGSCIHW